MKKVLIGTIANTRGLRGELKVLSKTDFKAERYLSGNPLFIEYEGKMLPVKVESFRSIKGFDLVTFKGLEDINRVERYKGCPLYAEDVPIQITDPNEFHREELLGLSIVQNSLVKGVVEEVKAFPQGDYLRIAKSDGQHALIPFRSEFILDIDFEKRTIQVVDMEGLL